MSIPKQQVEILQDTTTITGANLETLVDGSNADSLHSHAAGGGGVVAGTDFRMPCRNASTQNQVVQGVAATPGWTVIGRFEYVSGDHDNAGSGTLTRLFTSTVIASTSALQIRVRLWDTVGAAEVSGSLLTFAPDVSGGSQSQTADLTGALTTGRIHEIQAEVTGGSLITDFGTIGASLDAIFAY